MLSNTASTLLSVKKQETQEHPICRDSSFSTTPSASATSGAISVLADITNRLEELPNKHPITARKTETSMNLERYPLPKENDPISINFGPGSKSKLKRPMSERSPEHSQDSSHDTNSASSSSLNISDLSQCSVEELSMSGSDSSTTYL
jgi:hypothetical protein